MMVDDDHAISVKRTPVFAIDN